MIPQAERHLADRDIERCLTDLRKAIELIGDALNTLAAAREGEDAAVPAPRARHAMPSIGPRRPARHDADDW